MIAPATQSGNEDLVTIQPCDSSTWSIISRTDRTSLASRMIAWFKPVETQVGVVRPPRLRKKEGARPCRTTNSVLGARMVAFSANSSSNRSFFA